MVDETTRWRRPSAWVGLVAIIVLLVFLYYYAPFETYLTEHIPHVHFHNVIFWFASLVAVIGYIIGHWQSFVHNIFRANGGLNIETLVFETLQISILVAVIFCAGATLQAVEMLSEHLLVGDASPGPAMGLRILSIILLLILAILFYLLHHVVRAFRDGWRPRRPPPRTRGSTANN